MGYGSLGKSVGVTMRRSGHTSACILNTHEKW